MPTKVKEQKEAQPVPERPIWRIPCWLCGMPVEVRHSKKDKPFLICNNCGVQIFIRYSRAAELLIEKIKQQERENGNREISGGTGNAKPTKASKRSSAEAK
ncbi:hypothetical protein ACFLVP_04010 [Chloroflexota bacterium]